MECCQKKKKVRDEELKKKLICRTNRIIGQMNGIKNMIEDDRYCDDIMIQLAAVSKAIKSLTGEVLNEHIHSCVIDEIKNGNTDVVDEIVDLFKRY